MKKMKKVTSLILALLLVLGMSACSGGNQNEKGSADTQKEESQKDNAQKEDTGTEMTPVSDEDIEFWSVFTGPDGVNMTAMVEEYNATNPKFKVVHRPIEAGDFYSKLPVMVNSGEDMPDLAIVHAERMKLYAESKLLKSMDDLIAANGNIKAENYVPAAWKIGSIDGKQYSVPLDVHSFITYYNKDLLDKYGPNVLDDGAITFDEVREVSQKAKEDGIVGMGITWMRVKALSWYAQLGGDLSQDGENPDLNNEKMAKVFETVKALHDEGLTSVDGDDPVQLFQAGQMVFLPEGIWMRNNMTLIDTLNFGMTHMIQFDPKVKVNWTSSHQMVMLENNKMSEEKAKSVMDFIAWVADNSLEWAKAGQNPASLKILNNEEYKAMQQSFLLNETDTLKIFDYKYYGFAVEALDKVAWDIPFGKISVEEGMQLMQKEVEDRIKESK